jgi:hypothetical protein
MVEYFVQVDSSIFLNEETNDPTIFLSEVLQKEKLQQSNFFSSYH